MAGLRQTLWFERALLPGGWAAGVRLTTAGNMIEAVQAEVDPAPGVERHAIAIPGLANVHSHGFQRALAGLTERAGSTPDDFWTWREQMYRLVDRMTPEDVLAVTAQAYVEMLEGGFTRVGEFHYLHNDFDGVRYGDPSMMAAAVIAAAEESGIALTLLPVFYAHGDFGGADPSPRQRRFVSDVDGFARLVEASRARLPADAALGIAPHSLRAVTPDELRAILPLGADGPIHMHIAEQWREVEACRAWSGARPVQWLFDNFHIDARWCLIHATHMDDPEIERLAASGAVAGLCPITEANLGDGTSPALRLLQRGGRFGVGSDSNILIDAAGELRALEYSQRLLHRRRALLGDDARPSVGRRLFDTALRAGAQALGVEAGLAAGKPADLVTLNADHPSLADADEQTILDRWIFAARAGAIDCSWRGARLLVRGGRHINGEAIASRYRAAMGRLLA